MGPITRYLTARKNSAHFDLFHLPISPASKLNTVHRLEIAKYNREVLRISREQAYLEKNFKQSVRKLKTAQRGVISLLGKDLYPDLLQNPATVLPENNEPGFCFRRNGEPRRRCLLVESRTRKIIHDMEGKEGILSEPASNVLSDNPILSEVLSSPEIVGLLCDLRTTSAILEDPKLYRQFEFTMLNNPPNPLPFDKKELDDAITCLRRYRTNLIHEFFDALSDQTSLRLGDGTLDQLELKHLLGFRPDSSSSCHVASSQDEIVELGPSRMTEKEWTETLLAKLKEIAATDVDSSATPSRNRLVSIDQTVPENTGNGNEGTPNTQHPPQTHPQSRITRRKKKSLEEKKRESRRDFDKFVKSLISEVENVTELDKSMHALRRRNPSRRLPLMEPFIKLIGKGSFFSSLHSTHIPTSEYAKGVNGYESITPGVSGIPSLKTSEPSDPNSLKSHGDVNNTINSTETQKPYRKNNEKIETVEPPLKSIHRVCCLACKAKLKQACKNFRDRDSKDKIQSEAATWRTPGYSTYWTSNYSPGNAALINQHLFSGLPVSLRKSYNTFVPKANLFPMSSSNSQQFIHQNQSPRPALSNPALFQGTHTLSYKKMNLPNYYFGSVVRNNPSPGGSDGSLQKLRKSTYRNIGSPMRKRKTILSSSSGNMEDLSTNNSSVEFLKLKREGQLQFPLVAPNSWTLKVSTLDIVKLRHELDLESVREKIENFTRDMKAGRK